MSVASSIFIEALRYHLHHIVNLPYSSLVGMLEARWNLISFLKVYDRLPCSRKIFDIPQTVRALLVFLNHLQVLRTAHYSLYKS